jgi:hypothetical protein
MLALVLHLQSLVEKMPEETTAPNVDKRDALVRNKTNALAPAVQRLAALARSILALYFAGAAKALGACLARMHLEDFCGQPRAPHLLQDNDYDTDFMARFAKAVEVVRSDHLNALPAASHAMVAEMCIKLQSRVVSVFNRHVSMVRPLNSDGRVRLTNELAQFELAVQRLSCGKTSDDNCSQTLRAGAPYQELRALRQLLFVDSTLSDTAVEQLKALKGSVRVTTLWHAVFADAPPELRSPCDVSASDRQHREQAYVAALDKVEQDSLAQRNQHEDALDVGTSLVEPPEAKAFVWQHISKAIDQYMQMCSSDSQQLCTQVAILQALQHLVE